MQPLRELGKYEVHVTGAVKCAEQGESDVKNIMNSCFGSAFTEVRAQTELSGLNQLGSLMSSWDHLDHWMKGREYLGEVVGVFWVRADIRLLSSGCHLWPMDKLCFLWKTFVSRKLCIYASEHNPAGSEDTINDTLFFVPHHLFGTFRKQMKEGWHHDHLHWLSEMADLKEHTWVEFDCHHPSNTQKCWNPRYTMTSRQAAVDICKHQGKFMELSLRRRPDYTALEANSWKQMPHAADRAEAWQSRVLQLMRNAKDAWYSKQEMPPSSSRAMPCEVSIHQVSISIHEIRTHWYSLFPTEDICWWMPRPLNGLKANLQTVPFLEVRETSTDLVCTWTHFRGPGLRRDVKSCWLCSCDARRRPLWRCDECRRAACALCIRPDVLMHNNKRQRVHCETCAQQIDVNRTRNPSRRAAQGDGGQEVIDVDNVSALRNPRRRAAQGDGGQEVIDVDKVAAPRNTRRRAAQGDGGQELIDVDIAGAPWNTHRRAAQEDGWQEINGNVAFSRKRRRRADGGQIDDDVAPSLISQLLRRWA